MNFEIHFDQSPEYVYVQTSGGASIRGFDKLLTAIVESPKWKTGTKQLIDHRELILNKITLDDMRTIENIVKKHIKRLGNGRCAFVVIDALGFGMARMYELIGGEAMHQQIRVFYTIEEAIEWLEA